MRNERLRGKTVVITGASGGLGEQIAILCAQNGANIVLLARSLERLTDIADHIRQSFGVECLALQLDLSCPEEIAPVFGEVFNRTGQVDVLVNNAGFGLFTHAEETELADIRRMFTVNAVGLIACTKEVLPHMRERKTGHIINIASQAGKLATPKSSVYAATKHAVIGFTDSLRMEAGIHGISVTAVNPGPIGTSFFDVADPGGSYLSNLGNHVLPKERVAEKVVAAMLTNRREVNLPVWMNTVGILHELFPRLVERLGRRAFFKK